MKPPAFLFNVRDWLCSPSVARMTDKQARVYLSLLCYSWLDEPMATLPNDDAELARMAGVTPDAWDEIKGPILAKFQSDGNGRIFNERLKVEADYCEKRSFAGKAGWGKQRRKKQADTAKRSAQKRQQGT